MKPLRCTRHAQTAILERELEMEWVERTVREPDWIEIEPSEPGKTRRFRSIIERDSRCLRVVVVEDDKELRIVTAFFDRDARPK